MNKLARRIFLTLTILILWSQPLWAGEPAQHLEAMFEAACQALDIPKPLALAIAEVESDFHPWTLNIEGRGYRFDSKEGVLAKAHEARTAGRSFDVGLMQVNKWWLEKYDIPLETAFDPQANIYLGGWILKQELVRYGDDPRASAGAYHSPNPIKADRYARQIMAVLERGPQSQRVAAKNKVARASTEAKSAPLLVASRERTLAQSHSMKAAGTAAHNPSEQGMKKVPGQRSWATTTVSRSNAPSGAMKVKA